MKNFIMINRVHFLEKQKAISYNMLMKKYVLKETPPLVKKSFQIDYEKELNPAQLEAATILEGPILVIAGAGSGKTRTLVYRVARLVESGIPPENILAP